MANFRTALICIQARTDSKRFPRKAFADLEGKPVLQHVIDTCKRAALYMNKMTHKSRVFTRVLLAVPVGDEIYRAFRGQCEIIEGPPDDVLRRYALAAEHAEADYIIRVTGDCPLLPDFVISKNFNTAIMDALDYYSNVDPRFRTAPDGWDVEIMTRKVLDWANQTAIEGYDREHVTTLIRSSPPEWAKIGHTRGYLDLSQVKVSIDTPEDLEACAIQMRQIKQKSKSGAELYGKEHIHSQ